MTTPELPALKLPSLPSRSMADHERYIIELREVMRCRERIREARERILLARVAELESVLSETVALYGKPGGPWNITSDPAGWLERARAAISGSGVK